jgi:hypothetical protein
LTKVKGASDCNNHRIAIEGEGISERCSGTTWTIGRNRIGSVDEVIYLIWAAKTNPPDKRNICRDRARFVGKDPQTVTTPTRNCQNWS